jgi:hypothetical protein
LFVMKFCEKREARELSFPHIHVQCTHESMKHHRINDSWFSPSHNLLSSTDRGWSILRNTIRTSLMWQTTQVKGWHLRPSPAACLLPCSWLMTHDSLKSCRCDVSTCCRQNLLMEIKRYFYRSTILEDTWRTQFLVTSQLHLLSLLFSSLGELTRDAMSVRSSQERSRRTNWGERTTGLAGEQPHARSKGVHGGEVEAEPVADSDKVDCCKGWWL